jgi:ATPase
MVTRIIPDSSIVIDGKMPEIIERLAREEKEVEVVVPIAVLDELQAQASKGREPGFVGLEELKKLRALCDEKRIKMRFTGKRPSMEDIQLAHSGRLDAIIRDVAKQEEGELVTADYVQALVAEAEGVRVRHVPSEVKTTGLKFEKFFDENTISVHLKEDVVPMAKRGVPGDFKLARLGEEPLSREDVEAIIREITDATRISEEGSVEISRRGALVMQLGDYRIAIARPPFSDGLEVTIVKPIVKLTLEDYKLSGKLMKRLHEKAEGILIAGPPGAGKTSLASSLADFYVREKNVIVKTLESPKDLQVGPEITQYGPLEGDFEKTAEILLLVRPDYSVFDEVRKTKDFEVFADMRLSGVGMIGVVHASKAIDAIQRFMGRVELGMIPHIIDTIIFVEAGEVKKVYEIGLVVKVPTGMTEADLSRPVVEVRDFDSGSLEYEIYTFGEENIVVPVQPSGGKTESPVSELARQRVMQEIRKFDPHAEVELKSANRALVRVDNKIVPRIIGKEGAVVSALEGKLGIHIDIEPKVASFGEETKFKFRESGNAVELSVDKRLTGESANVYVDSDFLFSAIVGKKGKIKVTKDSEIGRQVVNAIVNRKKIRVLV